MEQGKQRKQKRIKHEIKRIQSRKEFAIEKKKHNRICKESEEKQRKEEIKKIMNIKDETEIWKYIREKSKRETMEVSN